MKLRDLGRLDGTVLVFGGSYSNLQATRALIAEAGDRGIPASHVICTGDLVAYCAAPAETVAAIRAFGCPVVAGNCEKHLAVNELDCGCGFEAGTVCDRLSAGWFAHADAAIRGADRAWMSALPDMITFTHNGQRMAVIHGGATDVSRFLWPVSSDAELTEEINEIQRLAGDISCIFSGHSGFPFARQLGPVQWVNAGAIGLPPHDGAPATRYAILREGAIRFHDLRYDHHAASAEMQARGLTQGYDRALLSGYWPSEDVLPPALRMLSRASG